MIRVNPYQLNKMEVTDYIFFGKVIRGRSSGSNFKEHLRSPMRGNNPKEKVHRMLSIRVRKSDDKS